MQTEIVNPINQLVTIKTRVGQHAHSEALKPPAWEARQQTQGEFRGAEPAFATPDGERPREAMNTDDHVQHDQVQADLVVELVNLEVRESTGFLEPGQIHDDLEHGSATFTLGVHSPELLEDRGSEGSDDGSSVPVVMVEEPTEGAGTLETGAFRSGVTVSFEESGDQSVEGLKLMVGGDEGLDGVEYGSGFFVHETVRILTGTGSPA